MEEELRRINETQLVNDLQLGGQTLFLLGAGCSISSGCKASSMLVKDFKLRIFCAENNVSYEETANYSDSDIIRITESMPTHKNDYSYYFEKCFPLREDRNTYIQQTFKECNPSLGYLCFANYLLSKGVKTVATTNFDRLVCKSLLKICPNVDIGEISDKSDTIGEHDIRVLSLHGDYHYDLLKNTEDEVKTIGEKLKEKFVTFEYNKIVVIGYSGQDQSVLNAIKEAILRKPDLRIIWCCHESDPLISDEVISVLRNASSTIACCIDFDGLFIKMYKSFGPRNETIENLISRRESDTLQFSGPLEQQQDFLFNGYKASTLPFVYCSKIDDGSSCTSFKGDYYYLQDGKGRNRISIASADIPLSHKKHLLNLFITKSLKGAGLNSYRNLLFKGVIDGQMKDALEYKVVFLKGSFFLTLSPTYTFGRDMNAEEKIAINAKTSRLFTKNNKEQLDKLVDEFFGDTPHFSVGDNVLAFEKNDVILGKGAPNFAYTQLNEPEMVVNGYKGKNQLGLAYDHGPTKSFFQRTKIRMAVICPNEKKRTLNAFLQSFINSSSGINPDNSTIYRKFPGFKAFTGINLELTGDKNVFIDSKKIASMGSFEFLDFIEEAVRRNYETQQPDLVLVFFTKEMEKFRKVDGVDFHDALKARVLNTYKTQFLEETTLDFKDDKNKILVNLALAIYTKTVCLPWTPKNFDKDKFFLGMAFGVAEKGLSVSCSQLFDGAGRGLMLLTSPVTNKNAKNPYLSEDEAYTLGVAIRSEYYKTLKPYDLKKIVVHRTVPFKKEEITGFKRAFEGLDDFSLLQIIEFPSENVYPLKKDGTIDGYPAKRGTTIQIDDDSLLLWTDGSVREPDVLGNRTYRGSKHGMSRPIRIKKFYGKQNVEEIASDILNLTKMDFNSSDALYSRMPVTVKYARILSQILKYKDIGDDTDLIDFRYIM